MDLKVPLFEPELGDREKQALIDVIDSGWLTQGERTAEFEQRFSAFLDIPHAIAVSNCTAALHLSLMALGIKPGDDVICPSMTFVATANAIRYCGANPVFADVNSLDDWNINRRTIESVITDNTRAIIMVHYAGYVCDMTPVTELAKERGLKIIEDVAHAPGASRDKRKAGTLGDTGCFSFFSNKNMTTGEGGMITTHDPELAQRLSRMRCHGMTSVTMDRHKGHNFSYDVVDLGFNYRMSELNAAIGLVQLERLDSWNKSRAANIAHYRSKLPPSCGVDVPFADAPGTPANHIFPVLLPDTVTRVDVMTKLRERGVQSSIHYRPVHTFTDFAPADKLVLPNTDVIGQRVLTLPLYPGMSREQIDYVCDSLLGILSE